MTLYDVFFWAPFGILAAGVAIYVMASWRYWFIDDQRHHPAE